MVGARAQPAGQFYLLHLGGALVLAAAALLIVERLRIDWWVSSLFFDPESGRFPLSSARAGWRRARISFPIASGRR